MGEKKMIISMPIEEWQKERAKKQRDLMPNELKNSIRHGEGTLIGKLGEQVIATYLGIEMPIDTYNYDMVYKEKKIEVKTKETSVSFVHPSFECSISNYNPNQKCDYYAFLRIFTDHSKAWVCGFISKKDFFKKATLHKKGEIDNSNNFTFKCDCYNLPYSELEMKI